MPEGALPAALIHDPGAALALAPLLSNVPESRLRIFASEFSKPYFSRLGRSVENLFSNGTPADVERLLGESLGNRILTGTSWNSNVEQTARNLARARGTPTFTFVDFWSAYDKRWEGSTYSPAQSQETILTLDQAMAVDLQSHGFHQAAMIAIGHPHLASLARQARPTPRLIERILILSSPRINGASGNAHASALAAVPTALNTWRSQKPEMFSDSLELWVKPHPKESPWRPEGEYGIQPHRLLPPGDFLADHLPHVQLVLATPTVGLLEARALNIPTLGLVDRALSTLEESRYVDAGVVLRAPTTLAAPLPENWAKPGRYFSELLSTRGAATALDSLLG